VTTEVFSLPEYVWRSSKVERVARFSQEEEQEKLEIFELASAIISLYRRFISFKFLGLFSTRQRLFNSLFLRRCCRGAYLLVTLAIAGKRFGRPSLLGNSSVLGFLQRQQANTIPEGRKFNAKKQEYPEKYLNAIQVYSFHIKCTRCAAPIEFKT
jgi:hypothetical protein